MPITAIKYSANSETVVNHFEANVATLGAAYWNDIAVSPVRAEIKEHYKIEQNFHCSFCNNRLPVKHSGIWDAEHIVPKDKHPLFMFVPKNLCIACKDCNGSKSNKSVLKNEKRITYPTVSDGFLIVHPHFDRYEDHIAVVAGMIYTPKTDKGKFTIHACDLLRFSYQSVGWNPLLSKTPEILMIASELLKSPTESDRERLMMELLFRTELRVNSALVIKNDGNLTAPKISLLRRVFNWFFS